MLDFFKPSFWFQKRTSALDDARVRMEQMSQYNALFHLDPDKIVSAVTQYNAGNLGSLAHIIRDLEQHDDKMATCSMKMKASVGRCDWSVQVKDGFEDDERAKRHVEILKRFWSTVSVTDRFKMNERGGIRLLKKQMMEAQSFGYAVHEIVWKPCANGEIAAEFVKLPLWHFENKTGALRFLPTSTSSDGVPMAEGEWLVTTGDGVGIPAAICAMAKRMSFQDWLLFSERSGMPIIVGKTGAAFKSDQWNNIKSAIRSIYRDTRVLLDSASSIEAIDTGHAANIPFPPLVEWADRAIAALYRGADLSTISKGDGTGASLQGDEAGMIEQDAAENLSEALQEQVDAFVIRYVTGDAEPLAKIVIEPVTQPDVDTDIKIDEHLVSMGCRLSKRDMMQRYGRTEATSDDDVAEQKKPLGDSVIGGLGDLGRTLPNETTDHPITKSPNHEILAAFAADMSPAGKAVQELLNALESGADVKAEAASLLSRLPSLLPDDPATAAVIAEAMAKEFGTVELANQVQRVPSGHGNGGQFTGKTNQPRGQSQDDDEHTPEEKKRIAEYEASTDQRVVDFVKKMDTLDNDARNDSWITICDTAPQNLTDKIKDEVGVDCSGFGVELTGSHVKHVDNRHGTNGAQDQSMADPVHFGRINYVLNHFDSVEALKDQNGKQVYSEEFKDRNNKPSPVVNVRMRINGTIAVQQAVPDSKLRKLRIVSVRIEKRNGGR